MSLNWKKTSVKAQREARTYAQQREDAAAIAFVVLAEGGQIDAVTASEQSLLFAEWEPGIAYAVGQLRRYGDTLYKCVQAHTSQADWMPPATPALWAVTSDPAEEWPEWSQPLGAHDAYSAGDKVSHSGKHWTSSVDGNVWKPGVYGWTEYVEPAVASKNAAQDAAQPVVAAPGA